jgi:hypothetical protein
MTPGEMLVPVATLRKALQRRAEETSITEHVIVPAVRKVEELRASPSPGPDGRAHPLPT